MAIAFIMTFIWAKIQTINVTSISHRLVQSDRDEKSIGHCKYSEMSEIKGSKLYSRVIQLLTCPFVCLPVRFILLCCCCCSFCNFWVFCCNCRKNIKFTFLHLQSQSMSSLPQFQTKVKQLSILFFINFMLSQFLARHYILFIFHYFYFICFFVMSIRDIYFCASDCGTLL